MTTVKKLLFAIVCFSIYATSLAMENAFYILRGDSPSRIISAENELASLKQHYQAINILISQAYQVDRNGVVWGFVDPSVLDFVHKHSMKLMVMVTNHGFDGETVHQFLLNPRAQKNAIQSIVDIAEKQHYYGVQFDFEMVPLTDRDALTQFFQAAADALHKASIKVSFAVGPAVSDRPTSDFLKRVYENWIGAYDLKKLAESADFLTIMTYNQHGTGTTPGPSASVAWVEKVINYTLQFVPAKKISLGIPTTTSYWVTAPNDVGKITAQDNDISYNDATYLINKYNIDLQWNKTDKIHYAIFSRDWLNEYLFIEDEKSFAAKVAMAKKYKLRGISVFALGTEDPKIWKILTQ